MKKGILFDLDNTLYEYGPAHKKGLTKVYHVLKKEIKISKKRFDRLFSLSRADIHRELSGTASSHNRILYFQRLIERTQNTVKPRLILKLYNAYWDTFLKNMKLKKGVLKVLKELKIQGRKIVLVSDLTAKIQLRKIEKLKLTPYVDYLVTSEEAGSEKPHSIMFLLALHKLNILPSETIMIGDNKDNDIAGANAVKIESILIYSGNKKPKYKEDYRNPKYYIKEIPEVLNILKKMEEK